MAGNKYLTITATGLRNLIAAIQTSLGVSSAGQIVALNASGVIDTSMQAATIDNAVIGGTTPAAASFTTLSSTSTYSASGKIIASVAGAVSAPAFSLTGAPYSGGSATTTKPLALIESSGTTSTGWSVNGTMLGINAPSGFTGNLIDIQMIGASKVSVNYIGAVTLNGGLTVSGNFNNKNGLYLSGFVTLTTATTLTTASIYARCNAASAAFTVTLPLAPTLGQVVFLKKIDSSANAVTISANGGTIDGASTYSFSTQYQAFQIICTTATSGAAVWDII